MATGAGDPHANIGSIAREIAQVFQAQMASVFLHNNGSGPKHITGYDISPRFLRALDDLNTEWDILMPPGAREPNIVHTVAAQGPTEGISNWASSTGIATLAVTPLSVEGRPIGALVLYHREQFNYEEEDRLVLRALAGLTSPVIARTRLASSVDGSQSALFNILGHELRTPLTAIMGFTQMIRKRVSSVAPADKRLLEQLDILWVQSQRLNRLIDSFVDLGRIERGDFRISPSRLELTSLLQSVSALVQSQSGAAFSLKMSLPPRPVWLTADARRLEQVFSHLLTNAAKYSPPGVPVSLTCEADHGLGTTVVRITDRGPGISSGRIMEIFSGRYPTGPLKSGGLGIGLYLSKVGVEAHGGNITIDTSSEGTAVTITLPL